MAPDGCVFVLRVQRGWFEGVKGKLFLVCLSSS